MTPQWYVGVLVLLLFYVLVAEDEINFDEYGNKYQRFTLQSGTIRDFEMSLENDEQYIYILASKSAEYKLIHTPSNTTFQCKYDSSDQPYFILEPTNTNNICSSYPCNFNLVTSHTYSFSKSLWIRLNRNIAIKPNKKYSGTIDMHKRRKYGIKLKNEQLPVLVKMIPNQKYTKMDIDLYAYHEKKFTDYYFPNRNERNHVRNYPEEILITSFDSYYHNDYWNFIEIYGSTDSSYNEMSYNIQVITNYKPNTILKKILLVIAFTLATSFIFGVFFSFFCTFRNQILYFLRFRSTPHEHGASKRQMKKLTVKKYSDFEIPEEEANCIICLDDYSDNDDIRILNCQHHFHLKCSNEWLFINKKCPLCNQEIDKAQSVFNNVEKFEIEMVPIHDQSIEFDEVQSSASLS